MFSAGCVLRIFVLKSVDSDCAILIEPAKIRFLERYLWNYNKKLIVVVQETNSSSFSKKV